MTLLQSRYEKAELLRGESKKKKLDLDKISLILSGEFNKKPKPKTLPSAKIKPKIYSKYFSGDVKIKEIEEIIEVALQEYFENLKNKEEELNGTA